MSPNRNNEYIDIMSTSTVEMSNKRKLSVGDHQFHLRKQLYIEIPLPLQLFPTPSTTASLFSARSLFNNVLNIYALPTTSTCRKSAITIAPSIPSLYFSLVLKILVELADSVTSFCMSTYFNNPNINQIMLFTRFSPKILSSLPPILLKILDTLSLLLKPYISNAIHSLLFSSQPTQLQQVILNLYTLGEGISLYVDLLKRFGDGIVSVSLVSGCVMWFAKASNSEIRDHDPARTTILDEPMPMTEAYEDDSDKPNANDIYDLYLPEWSIVVLSSNTCYKWTHEIEKQKSDFVAYSASFLWCDFPLIADSLDLGSHWVDRDIHLSVTFCWLLPEADVVGIDDSSPDPKCGSFPFS